MEKRLRELEIMQHSITLDELSRSCGYLLGCLEVLNWALGYGVEPGIIEAIDSGNAATFVSPSWPRIQVVFRSIHDAMEMKQADRMKREWGPGFVPN